MLDYYILDGMIPVPVDDVITWAKWFETAERHVALTHVTPDIDVSTVFLGLDHSWGSVPILFETMVFGGELDQEMKRYSTWEQAVVGHNEIVERVKQLL